ncbi:MAG TPA: TetR/AcrR family transcriptional regulator [Candidatus Gallibacteroides avistercoris]|uniref:TetR/AcrR family transcriptional regulator n=1 Tax=Candidatus Gallibacteroides avistercoris TaxID=2840833 RepID=A0A9D1M5H1_9BACT|nr:TetR/AcrR family transcriptional regulator [Candidatus Gallibacteroides avistercoris]
MDAKVKERVIRIATDLFLRYGIKAITMDYIAGQLGMSKRTLYEIFKDKDSLLLSCVQHVDEERVKEVEEIKKKTTNSIELFLSVYQRSLQKLRCTNQNYFSDLKKYHPSVFVYYEANKEKNLQNFIMLLEQGMNEGYIRKELNVEIISFLLSAQLELLIKSNDIYLNKYSFMEVFETIVMNFVRGIATPKGVAFIDEFVNRNSI